MAVVRRLTTLCLGLLLGTGSATGQELPAEELQVNLSSYFDNFDVQIVYPNVAYTRSVSETTSLTGRYLIDVVSAASIRGEAPETDNDAGRRVVDVVTSASGREEEPEGPDDLRHEFGFGMTTLVGGGLVSVNGIYGTENDYTSTTIANTLTRSFAKKNTTIQLGYVRSWDEVFPATKTWRRDKNVDTFSANLTQILSTRLVGQFLFSYSNNRGHLSDDYQLVTINSFIPDDVVDPIHPDTRIRKAFGSRFKVRTGQSSSLELGYRYYWDTWDVNSHTLSVNLQHHLSRLTTVGVGLRTYLQGRASFFKDEYTRVEEFMTADIKLDSSYSNELQISLSFKGDEDHFLPLLTNENVSLNVRLNLYQRHTDAPYWFNGKQDLLAGYFNVGVRYKF